MPGTRGSWALPDEAWPVNVLALAPPDGVARCRSRSASRPPTPRRALGAAGPFRAHRLRAFHGETGAHRCQAGGEGPGGEPSRPILLPWQFRGGSEMGRWPRIAGVSTDRPCRRNDERLAPSEIWDISAFVGTLARRPAWEEQDPARIRNAGAAAPARARPLPGQRHACRSAHPSARTPGRTIPPCSWPEGASGRYPWSVSYSGTSPRLRDGLGAWSEEPSSTPWPAGFRGRPAPGRDGHAVALVLPPLARDARAIGCT